MRKKKDRIVLEDLQVSDYAAEGKAMARLDGKVIFVSGAVPGDVADVLLTKNKKDWAEGRVLSIKSYSPDRETPFCGHFGICGGCKWQMLPYARQLQFKAQEAEQNMRRIGKVELPELLPIIGADETVEYRNKLEFTFSNKRYLTTDEINDEASTSLQNALGFHAPRIFDKVIDIDHCYLMDPVNDAIRNTIRSHALEKGYSFYDIRQHTGWLRNIIIRYCTTGELMVNICLNHDEENHRKELFDHLLKTVPQITTLLYTINPKWNDSIYDLEPQVYFGKGYAMEKLGGLDFKISPKSFFQTNTKQAEKLYRVALDFAGLTGKEVLYDLYCGTGSIGIFMSKQAKKVIGVEVVEDAVVDARENAALNGIAHAEFFAGDVIKVCNDEFFARHGRPDVIVTDPPRAGMHEKLIQKLLEIAAPTLVYVSCNTATQARDIGLLAERYRVEKVQPVDMFPHTHHIECVALLRLK
ncbi:MAG: 23S rRNA (uracil(1939)-C(5))-methyltransferase RlmD [Chitinophagaceae bacterium]|nr:23S rRNA (uracil(1939)-C(5))-methyltransferase RlmD [Chitinophagaceae bacterium]MBL0055203.1 23S rRNA (uracil(1939)-C(5))-methyltransferase RlmD [Chitinophagaceae bacterium]